MPAYRVDVPIYVSVYVASAESADDAQAKAISALEFGIGCQFSEIKIGDEDGVTLSPACSVIDKLEIDTECQDDEEGHEADGDTA